ncbi:Peroxisomal 2,4-dienoyl-CoA reductase SPS19 [Sparassis crispa]|uniref:2,4-dienoyl-CoA reductase [(3E)-enoyl-CoA-producing] n=1 Tax=Sparassis crispa TaxID=139825 RepID=A0A401G9F9_9APHY|nr:Peroxisomal 2,4-dienoyl-CoA reductase SPS19 [Sparassis crispa]GBE78773.1 Peroxisomal 2,4-dienoyl-CoA reductase SPS19 [Sparassis crispa]
MAAYVAPVVPSTAVFKDGLFDGKVLFCTGGGSGICKAMTEAVMRHGANATIVGRKLDRLTASAAELAKATGRECLPAQADVRDPKQVHDAVAKTIAKFGRIDYVICGAAGNFLAPISGLSENGFKTVVEIDTFGTYNTIKATLPHVRASKGSYIHVSATLHYRGTPYQIHVSAAKAAVDAMSAVLAVEEGPHGVRSNVIAPGAIANTEGASRLMVKNTEYAAPAGRIGDVLDVANATIFLFSGAAAFISGQIIVVDGGYEHVRSSWVPYPQSVLDPASFQASMKPRL